MSLNLNLTSITDIYERQNFQAIQTYLNNLSTLINLTLISTKITAQDTQIAHNLAFTPTDLIQTSFQNSNLKITWLYEKFDAKNLYFTTEYVTPPSVQDNTKYALNILVGRLGLNT